MAEWHQHFIDLLKFMESRGECVREFRRSFESGSKKERVYPHLNDIYEKCRDKFDDKLFIDWFNSQSFRVKSGLKVIIIKCNTDKEIFEQYLRKLFSHWNTGIKFSLPEKIDVKPPPISKKKIEKAMKYLNNMDAKQLKRTASLASHSQLGNFITNSDIQNMAESAQENRTAKNLARKIGST